MADDTHPRHKSAGHVRNQGRILFCTVLFSVRGGVAGSQGPPRDWTCDSETRSGGDSVAM